jgi:hypothetical protein
MRSADVMRKELPDRDRTPTVTKAVLALFFLLGIAVIAMGAAAHAARAFELDAANDPTVGADRIQQARILAPPVVIDVLRRYPAAPTGGGRVGELIRQLDALLR